MLKSHKKESIREQEQKDGLHVTNAEGDVTAEQTSEQQQQGNATFDNQANQNLDLQALETKNAPKTPQEQQKLRSEQQDKINAESPQVTAEDMKGTITDPVSFSNPAYDPSIDAAKVQLKGKDAEKSSEDIEHDFKPGHFYKKGDKVRYAGTYFEAIRDGHGDLPPGMWAPSSK